MEFLLSLNWVETLKVAYFLIAYIILIIYFFINTVVLINMDNNYKYCLCKQCNDHVITACGSTNQLAVLSVHSVFIFVAQYKMYQGR